MARWLSSAVAAVALMVGIVAPATAIPVRNVKAVADHNDVYVFALIFSPPTAVGCGAYYAIGIYTDDGNATTLRKRVGRMNVCTTRYSDGWSRGALVKRFNVADLPIDDYMICISASQNLQNGGESTHTICRHRRF